MQVDLSRYDNRWYHPGRSLVMRTLWYFSNVLFLLNPLNPSSKLKIFLLRVFGARIGQGVVIKPGVNVKYPWNLAIGDHSWIGEGVWLDCLERIEIGNNVCISQGSYLCTGNHDWSDCAFKLVLKPIMVDDGSWIGAKAILLPGTKMRTHSIACAGSVLGQSTEAFTIYEGNPAKPKGFRTLN
jgi:putative colanic acid biosynthesis acetyltransferase WcaF